MALILLKLVWTSTGTYGDRNNGLVYGETFAAEKWEFDTTTRAVVHTAFPLGGNYDYDQSSGSTVPPPEDYSRDVNEEFFYWTAAPTRFGYFHDGAGGFTTKLLTATVTQIGINCFGAGTVQLLAVVQADPFYSAGPMTYLWDNGATTIGRGPVPAGTYAVTITDTATGASVTGPVTVGQRAQIAVVLSKVNNDLVVTASAGTAPYTYLWDDGVTTKDRTNVTAAGTYRVTVTDANGCTSTASTRIEQFRYWFSGNPIVLSLDAGPAYRLDPTTKPGLSFVCEVWVERVYLSEVFEQVGQVLEQPADAGGRTTFEVQELLEPFVGQVVPAVDQNTVQRVDGTFCRFYLKHFERTDAGDGTVTTLDQNYLVHGGLSFTEAAAGTWFSGYQDTQLPFLTWEPRTKKVLPDQPEFLYFMVPAFNLDSFRHRLRLYFADGSLVEEYAAPVLAPQRFEIYSLPAGPVQLALGAKEAAAGSPATHYVIDVVDAAGLPLSEDRTFVLNRRPAPLRRYFLYANSLGGFNTLVCRGRAARELSTQTSASDNARAAGYDALRGDYTINRRTGLPVLKCYAGARGVAQMQADQDFMLSERVLLLQGGRLVAGQVKDRTYTPADENETRLVLQFDFELPRERYFTPQLS